MWGRQGAESAGVVTGPRYVEVRKVWERSKAWRRGRGPLTIAAPGAGTPSGPMGNNVGPGGAVTPHLRVDIGEAVSAELVEQTAVLQMIHDLGDDVGVFRRQVFGHGWGEGGWGKGADGNPGFNDNGGGDGEGGLSVNREPCADSPAVRQLLPPGSGKHAVPSGKCSLNWLTYIEILQYPDDTASHSACAQVGTQREHFIPSHTMGLVDSPLKQSKAIEQGIVLQYPFILSESMDEG